MAGAKLIVDSDPGVDDVLAFLLALTSEDVDLKHISIVFGNCDTVNSLRNTVSLFHVLEMEANYRRQAGRPVPWANKSKPLVSVGLTTALDGTTVDATYYHGPDGLGNVHSIAPQFTAAKEDVDLFEAKKIVAAKAREVGFVPSTRPSYEDMLDILRQEDPGTVTIVAIGPLQNLARAAQIDPQAFARVKEVVVMGGAVAVPGNSAPLAEFNWHSDPLAAAQVLALSSLHPATTLPPGSPHELATFPNPVDITIFPLDITTTHTLSEKTFESFAKNYLNGDAKSPLAQWMQIWLKSTFQTASRLKGELETELHDPLALWYAISVARGDYSKWSIERHVDLRVETQGQWTKGMTVVDSRGRPKVTADNRFDTELWLKQGEGNRVNIARDSPLPGDKFGIELLNVIFGH